VLDLIFRPQCAACGTAATTLCEPCRATLVELGAACVRCAEPGDELCRRCREAPLPLDRILTPWRFGGQLAAAIRRLKFQRRANVARDLAPLWAPLVAAAADQAIVVSVPLHWRRRMIRGFDHSWLLARHACAAADLAAPVPALRRVRATPAQSKLSAEERSRNLAGAFVADPSAVAGRAVVLVDDVVTTGATLAAAARALLAAGAARVTGIAIARATSAPG
jgi:ComF family protein